MAQHAPDAPLRNPWMIAAWPGMGHVAATATSYLIEALKPRHAGGIDPRGYFEVNHVDVRDGIARSGQLPRSMFFTWRDPESRRDLVIFLGEAQPAARGYELCRHIVDFAAKQGVERVITFAAMGTRMHPASEPRVFGTATTPGLLPELKVSGVETLKQGRVGGLNGTLLVAAAERGLPALCLLGEMPFYAAAVSNVKSSRAILDVFSSMAGLQIDTDPLDALIEQSDAQVMALMEQIRSQAPQILEQGTDVFEGMDEEDQPAEAPRRKQPTKLDADSQRRIEELFGAAGRDRARVGELKQELDRLGVFKEYEDRFLDLFRKAG